MASGKRIVVASVFTLFASAAALAQCSLEAVAGSGMPGANGRVKATILWDPDGAGPAPQQLVAAGLFTQAGTAAASRIVTWDPVTHAWTALGSGLDGIVNALAVMPNGDLIAGGSFANAGGVPANRVARWDGSSWSALGVGIGPGTAGHVHSLCVMPNGDLIVAGSFNAAGGFAAASIARWNGAAWSTLGAGLAGNVESVVVLPNGNLVAGGGFSTAGGVPVDNVALWNGTAWSAFPAAGFAMPYVYSLFVLPNGDLLAGGEGSLSGVWLARWNGTSWSSQPAPGRSQAFALLPNGDLVAGGVFALGGSLPDSVARWNGTSWSVLGSGLDNGHAESLTVLPNGDLVIGGEFTTVGGLIAHRLARWDGTTLGPLLPAEGPNNTVRNLGLAPNGDLIVGGGFTKIGDQPFPGLARWNGSWSGFVGGGDILKSTSLVVVRADGSVVVTGLFQVPGSPFDTFRIASWDGAQWNQLGGVPDSTVYCLFETSTGDLLIAGSFQSIGGVPAAGIARWDGTAWQPLGGGLTGHVTAVAETSTGVVLAARTFGINEATVQAWDGVSWSQVGGAFAHLPTVGQPQIMTLLPLPNGDCIAGGNFLFNGPFLTQYVALWSGGIWQEMYGGLDFWALTSLLLPDGDVLIGGKFSAAGGLPAPRLARWNGGTWTIPDVPITGPMLFSDVWDLQLLPTGELVTAGSYETASPLVPRYLTRFVSTCPAFASAHGVGCPSSGGSNTLAALSLPWVNAVFHSRATGLPLNAVPLVVIGFKSAPQGAVPLTGLLPSPAGCDLLVAPDILMAGSANGGIADFQLHLVNTPPLVGMQFFLQMLPVDLGGAGLEVTATNALDLYAGEF